MKQILRIIAGKHKGKKLHFPEVEGLRPTPNRVRETLFNWLMHSIQDIRCLDAFAGSGALGFEAYSRGARSVFFLEQSKIAYLQLKKNAEHFNNPDLQIIQTDACVFLQESNQIFDLIFLDPPFHHELLPLCIEIIKTRTILSKGGLLYIESNQPINMDSTYWEMLQHKSAGAVYYGLYRKLI